MAGHSRDATAWVYLAVSSANLTLSGWGRNAESFGETWIHTRRQQAWCGLDALLGWLQERGRLGEHVGNKDAVTTVRAVLSEMPDRRRFQDRDGEPWCGSLQAQFYCSVVHKRGLPSFLKTIRKRKPTQLWCTARTGATWAEGVREFGAKSTVLIPALRRDRKAMGLSKAEQGALDDTSEVCGNAQEAEDDRFWHMKAYWIYHGNTAFTAVGSCNFTEAGLAGSTGNVEAMLVFESMELEWPQEREEPVLPAADEAPAEEETPTPIPVAIIVAYDWQSRSWRWSLDADPSQSAFRLKLPGDPSAVDIVAGLGQQEGNRHHEPRISP